MIEAVVGFFLILVFLLFIYGLAHLIVWESQVVYNYQCLPEKDKYFEKLKRTVEEKKRIEKQAEEEKLKIEAEERIRAQSQIWVIE